MTTKIEAVANFLSKQRIKNDLWTPEQETQVNVHPDGGERVTKVLSASPIYTDGINQWAGFRIPWNAKDNPNYDDKPIQFDLSKKVEAIGVTGFDWVNKKSIFVGLDFDSMVGHKNGLTQSEISEVAKRVSDIPWVTVVNSKSGQGIHLFVHFQEPLDCANHTEHKAWAELVIDYLSCEARFDFKSKVDCYGSVLWVWHRQAVKKVASLLEVSEYSTIDELYNNTKNLPFQIVKQGVPLAKLPGKVSDKLKNSRKSATAYKSQEVIELSPAHQQVTNWLRDNDKQWWWDSQKHMLVCHTYDLKLCHRELGLVGLYDTVSKGEDSGSDHNCFCFPARNGSWVIRRFGGSEVKEHTTWSKDTKGNPYVYFNTTPTFKTVMRAFDGSLGPKGDYEFQSAKDMLKALKCLSIELEIEPSWEERLSYIRPIKGKLIDIGIQKVSTDPHFISGFRSTDKKFWTVCLQYVTEVVESKETDDELIRNVVSQDKQSSDFYVHTDKGDWLKQSNSNVTNFLKCKGFDNNQIPIVIGKTVVRPWWIVNKPWEPEYPGGREWNIKSAQLAFTPRKGKTPTWDMLLAHVGANLLDPVTKDKWCQENHILTGADYIKLWIANVFQSPHKPNPYLFLFSSQTRTGKTTFIEALTRLFDNQIGTVKCNASVSSDAGFNGEMDGSVLNYLDEVDANSSQKVLQNIKDWTTAATLSIHPKNKTPYMVPNYSNWIHCANNPYFAPVMGKEDTRVVMVRLSPLETILSKEILFEQLEREAPAFLFDVINLAIPEHSGRMRIPVLETADKVNVILNSADNDLTQFIKETTIPCDGHVIPASEFCDKFRDWLASMGEKSSKWSNNKIMRTLPTEIVKGKWGDKRLSHLANITFDTHEVPADTVFVCSTSGYLNEMKRPKL